MKRFSILIFFILTLGVLSFTFAEELPGDLMVDYDDYVSQGYSVMITHDSTGAYQITYANMDFQYIAYDGGNSYRYMGVFPVPYDSQNFILKISYYYSNGLLEYANPTALSPLGGKNVYDDYETDSILGLQGPYTGALQKVYGRSMIKSSPIPDMEWLKANAEGGIDKVSFLLNDRGHGQIATNIIILPTGPSEMSISAYKAMCISNNNMWLKYEYFMNGVKYIEYFETKAWFNLLTKVNEPVMKHAKFSGVQTGTQYLTWWGHVSRLNSNGHIVIDHNLIPLNPLGINPEYVVYDTSTGVVLGDDTYLPDPIQIEPIEEGNQELVNPESLSLFLVENSKNILLDPFEVNIIDMSDISVYAWSAVKLFKVEFRLKTLITVDDVTIDEGYEITDFVINAEGFGSFNFIGDVGRQGYSSVHINLPTWEYDWTFLAGDYNGVGSDYGDPNPEVDDDSFLVMTGKAISQIKNVLTGFFSLSAFIFTGLPPFITIPAGLIFSLVLFDYIRGR